MSQLPPPRRPGLPPIPPASAPLPIPQPQAGPGGFNGWLRSHFLPFLNSLPDLMAGPEFDKVVHVAMGAATIGGALATIALFFVPSLEKAVGPAFAPMVALAAGWLATHFGVRAKLSDSTDAAGNPVAASITRHQTAPIRADDERNRAEQIAVLQAIRDKITVTPRDPRTDEPEHP